MAYRRSLTTSARLFTQHRFTPSVSYVNHHEDRQNQHLDDKPKTFLQSRSRGVLISSNTNTLFGFGGGSGVSFRDPKWSQSLGTPMTKSRFMLARNMSTTIAGGAVSEVAAAAADSWLPVAAMQYAIDGIHNFTGLNWWASIVITTLIIRTSLSVPVNIYLRRFITKLSRNATFTRHEKKRTICRILIGLSIRGSVSCSYLLALANMVEKVPSFTTGGPSWFLNLATVDSSFVLPFLALFSFWKCIKLTEQGMRSPRNNIDIITDSNLCFISLMPFIPKVFFFHCITSNLFSLVYISTLKKNLE